MDPLLLLKSSVSTTRGASDLRGFAGPGNGVTAGLMRKRTYMRNAAVNVMFRCLKGLQGSRGAALDKGTE